MAILDIRRFLSGSPDIYPIVNQYTSDHLPREKHAVPPPPKDIFQKPEQGILNCFDSILKDIPKEFRKSCRHVSAYKKWSDLKQKIDDAEKNIGSTYSLLSSFYIFFQFMNTHGLEHIVSSNTLENEIIWNDADRLRVQAQKDAQKNLALFQSSKNLFNKLTYPLREIIYDSNMLELVREVDRYNQRQLLSSYVSKFEEHYAAAVFDTKKFVVHLRIAIGVDVSPPPPQSPNSSKTKHPTLRPLDPEEHIEKAKICLDNLKLRYLQMERINNKIQSYREKPNKVPPHSLSSDLPYSLKEMKITIQGMERVLKDVKAKIS